MKVNHSFAGGHGVTRALQNRGGVLSEKRAAVTGEYCCSGKRHFCASLLLFGRAGRLGICTSVWLGVAPRVPPLFCMV